VRKPFLAHGEQKDLAFRAVPERRCVRSSVRRKDERAEARFFLLEIERPDFQERLRVPNSQMIGPFLPDVLARTGIVNMAVLCRASICMTFGDAPDRESLVR
jgi:hypothetical protein